MTLAETAQVAANGYDVLKSLIGLGGPVLVAVTSVLTILATNRHNRSLKEGDYRREELNVIAEGLSATTKMLGILGNTIELLGTMPGRAADKKGDAAESLQRKIFLLNDEVPEADSKLTLIAFANPHEKIRAEAAKAQEAIKDTVSVGVHELLDAKGQNPKYSEAIQRMKDAKTQLKTLEAQVDEVYYSAKKKGRRRSSFWTARD